MTTCLCYTRKNSVRLGFSIDIYYDTEYIHTCNSFGDPREDPHRLPDRGTTCHDSRELPDMDMLELGAKQHTALRQRLPVHHSLSRFIYYQPASESLPGI